MLATMEDEAASSSHRVRHASGPAELKQLRLLTPSGLRKRTDNLIETLKKQNEGFLFK